MNLYQSTLNNIVQKAENKKSGKFNGIPFPYPRFRQYIPSIDPEQVIGITSFTGAGKSKFLRYNFVTYPYEFALLNNYKLEIDYYALEDSAEKVFKNILCNYLYTKHKEKISLYDLDSRFKELPSYILKKINEGEKYLSDFNNKVRIKDTFTTPFEIKRDTFTTAEKLGEIVTEQFSLDSGKTAKKVVGFKPKDDTHWMILCDNLNNIDKGGMFRDNKEAMDHFVQKDCRLIYSKFFKATCVIVHQQSLEAERQQFTNSGNSILEKVKPSLANLGGTKEVVRSYHTVFSLFTPHRFKIEDYKKYDTKLMGNNFREMEVLKHNDSLTDNGAVGMYFDGAPEIFRELPHPEKNPEELNRFYDWLQEERLKAKNKSLLF
jgi:hypothetical protein